MTQRPESAALARYRAAARQQRRSTGDLRRNSVRRGTESRSGPRKDARDPRPLGEVWRSLADQQGWTSDMAVWSLTNRWAEMVGPQVAEHVVVEKFDQTVQVAASESKPRQQSLLEQEPEPSSGGTLTLRADSHAWQQQMVWALRMLQRRLDEDLGIGVVGRIVVLGPAQPRSAGPRRAR